MRAGLLIVVALAVAGCAAEGDEAFGGAQDAAPPPVDMEPADCGLAQRDGGCDAPVDPCVAIDEAHAPFTCVDADGDCYPEACDKPLAEALRDCDDTRAAVRPGAIERCNDRDDDCDGRVDEGYDIGAACDGCGTPGKIECHFANPDLTACSTALGQSASPAEPPEERCSGRDDDCDGVVDERCVAAAAADAVAVRRCGADLYTVQADGALQLTRRAGTVIDLAPSVAAPGCVDGVSGWLELRPESSCDTTNGPWLCTDAALVVDAEIRHVGHLGAPHFGADGVLFTAFVDDELQVLVAPFDDSAPRVVAVGLSDGRRVEQGLIARSWDPPAIVRVSGDASFTLDAPPDPPGPPATGDGFAAWITMSSAPILWLAPVDSGPGLQIGPALPGTPWIVAGGVYWVDAAGLQRFDVQSGSRLQVLGGAIDPSAIDVTADGIAWIEDGQLRLSPLP